MPASPQSASSTACASSGAPIVISAALESCASGIPWCDTRWSSHRVEDRLRHEDVRFRPQVHQIAVVAAHEGDDEIELGDGHHDLTAVAEGHECPDLVVVIRTM